MSPLPAALLTCHDPLGLVGLHVTSTLSLSCFALEIILGIKWIRIVISDGYLQGARWQECESTSGFLLQFYSQPGSALTNTNGACIIPARSRGWSQDTELVPILGRVTKRPTPAELCASAPVPAACLLQAQPCENRGHWVETHKSKNLEGVFRECELLNLMEWKWSKVGKEIAESLEMLTGSWCWLRPRRACLEIIMLSVPSSPNLEHKHALGNQTTIW